MRMREELALFDLTILRGVALSALAHPALEMCVPGQARGPDETCVVEGDTLWLDGVNYRLKDFDTPEPATTICGGASEVELAHRASACRLTWCTTFPRAGLELASK